MQYLVFALLMARKTCRRQLAGGSRDACGVDDGRTQDRLKQSCEQKKALALPSLRQAGHCSVPAAFAQVTPAQNFLVGEEDAVEGAAAVDIVAVVVVLGTSGMFWRGGDGKTFSTTKGLHTNTGFFFSRLKLFSIEY